MIALWKFLKIVNLACYIPNSEIEMDMFIRARDRAQTHRVLVSEECDHVLEFGPETHRLIHHACGLGEDSLHRAIGKLVRSLVEFVFTSHPHNDESRIWTRDTVAALNLYLADVSRSIDCPSDDSVVNERRRAEPTTPVLYKHELVWMAVSTALCDESLRMFPHGTPRSTETLAALFQKQVVRALRPKHFFRHVTHTSAQELQRITCDAREFVTRLLETTSKNDPVTFSAIDMAERLYHFTLFFQRHTPVRNWNERERTHASGVWADPILAEDHPFVQTLATQLDAHVASSLDPDLPRCMQESAVASECTLGEFAAYQRASPEDSRVNGPLTVIARSGLEADHVKLIRETAALLKNGEVDARAVQRWREYMRLAAWSSIWSSRVPPPTAGHVTESTAGRAGLAIRVLEFPTTYVFPWMHWGTRAQTRRFHQDLAHARPRLPILLDLGGGVWIMRDGSGRDDVRATLVAADVQHGSAYRGRDPRPITPVWIMFKNTAHALAEWEVRARRYYDGRLERPCDIPHIAIPRIRTTPQDHTRTH